MLIMRTLLGDRLKDLIVRPSVITRTSKGHRTQALDGLHNLPVVVQSLIMRTPRLRAKDDLPKGLVVRSLIMRKSTDLRLRVLYDYTKGQTVQSLIMRTLTDRRPGQDRLKGQIVQSLIMRTLVLDDLPKGQAGLSSLIMKNTKSKF